MTKNWFLKVSIDNLAVSIAMSITASLLSGTWDKFTLICIPYSFMISTLITIFIPNGKVCSFMASLFKIEPKTALSDWVGGLFTNIYITAIISFLCKLLVFGGNVDTAFYWCVKTYIPSYIVSYLIYETTFMLSYKLYLKIENKKNQNLVVAK